MYPLEDFELTDDRIREFNELADKKIEMTLRTISETHLDADLLKYRDLLGEIFKEGKSLKEVKGLSSKVIEMLYARGIEMLNSGDYDGAISIFRLTMEMEPEKPRYPAAVASCHFRRGEWEKAYELYAIAAIGAPDDPTPILYAAECYINMNLLLEATFLLRGAIQVAKKDPNKWAQIERRGQIILDGIDKTLREKN